MDDLQFGQVSREERRHLYWATNGWSFPVSEDRIIQPRRWVATSDLFAELSRDVSPAAIAALGCRLGGFGPHPSLDKCVAEYVYEQIRERELPDAPSRLNCLFAARDAYAAVEFASMYMPLVIGPTGDANIGAAAVSTADGAWVELDMSLFSMFPVQARNESEIAESLAALTERATHYWHGEESATPFSEILAEKLWKWTAFIDGDAPPPYATWVTLRHGPSGE